MKAAIQDVATSKCLMEAENIALKAEVKMMKTTLAQVAPGESEDKGMAAQMIIVSDRY